MSLLEIKDLKTHYHTSEGKVHAVDGVSLSVERGESIGLVGESGSGKTTLAKSINQILADNAEIVDGSIKFEGTELTNLSKKELNKIRWNEIAYIPQSAMNALDPVYTVGEQIVEVIQAHEDKSTREAKKRGRELFGLVGLDRTRIDDYPHQFSGGMKQRAMIALALALDPKLLIADEPTTALDVIIQTEIMQNIKELQDEIDVAMMLVTHDISVVSQTCEKIAVFYGGRIVEKGRKRTIIKEPNHPYTLGLRNAFPNLLEDQQELTSIPGVPPDLINPEQECRFIDRCPFAEEQCQTSHPESEELEPGHSIECYRADEESKLQTEAAKKSTWEQISPREQ